MYRITCTHAYRLSWCPRFVVFHSELKSFVCSRILRYYNWRRGWPLISENLRNFIPTQRLLFPRVDLFFVANGIADEKKVAVFLSTVGGRIYSLLRDLLSHVKPQEITMAELQEVLKNHFEPKPLVIAESFYLYRRNQ